MKATGQRSHLKVSQQGNGNPEIFLSIQGEGHSVGKPAVFLRLAMCNLTCTWCDTKYTWDWHNFDYQQEVADLPIIDVERTIRTWPCQHLVITGGEPLLQQKSLIPLVESLSKDDYSFEIETNGTILPDPDLEKHIDQWNVSLKLANSGIVLRSRQRPRSISHFATLPNAYFKFVIMEPLDIDEVHNLVDSYGITRDRVMLMPEGRNAETLLNRSKWLTNLCLNEAYRFSPRLHIILWGDKRAT